MKRFVFCIIFITLCTLSFGLINELNMNLEFSGGYSLHAAKEDVNYNGFPFQSSFNLVANNRIIIETYLNFIFMPGDISIASEEAYRLNYKNDNFMIGWEFYLGAGSFLLNTERIKIPFSAGFHLKRVCLFVDDEEYYWINYRVGLYGYDEYEYYDTFLGLGFNLGMRLYASNRIYLFGRIQGAFDFINTQETILYVHTYTISGRNTRYRKTYGTKNTGLNTAFGLSPHLGIGIRSSKGLFPVAP